MNIELKLNFRSAEMTELSQFFCHHLTFVTRFKVFDISVHATTCCSLRDCMSKV